MSHKYDLQYQNSDNLFHDTAHWSLFIPLEIISKSGFSDVFKGYTKDNWHEMGYCNTSLIKAEVAIIIKVSLFYFILQDIEHMTQNHLILIWRAGNKA